MELFYELRKSVFLKRVNKHLQLTRNDELSLDEISEKVMLKTIEATSSETVVNEIKNSLKK